jgi:hypothetical protein
MRSTGTKVKPSDKAGAAAKAVVKGVGVCSITYTEQMLCSNAVLIYMI